MELLHHFSHQHPLILHEGLKENDDQEIACYGCDKPIMGPNYSCSRDCNYFLHNSCAELPKKMQHWLHPKHPLTLIQKRGCLCDACGHPVPNLTYNCALCDLNLDLKCVSLPRTIEHGGHEHPFTLLTKRAKFCCDACGEEGDGMSYLCSTCQFWVHLECASLHYNIKLSDHVHPLTLTYSLQVQGDDDSRDCRICDEEVKTDHWVYHCADCSFLAHVDCTTSKRHNNTRKSVREKGRVRDGQTARNTDTAPSDSLLRTIVRCYHEHPLNLMLGDAEFRCDACSSQGNGSFSYICTTCQFWVDSECALFPKSINLSFHQHLFALSFSFKLDGSNDCALCSKRLSTKSGWVYHCDDCHEVTHVHCAKEIIRNGGVTLLPSDDHLEEPNSVLTLVPDESIHLITNIRLHRNCVFCVPPSQIMKLRVERGGQGQTNRHNLDLDLIASSRTTIVHCGHEHPLSLRLNAKFRCNACHKREQGSFYVCTPCHFQVHSECALLPNSFKVADRGHLFSVICSRDLDDWAFCRFCGQELKTQNWVYGCSNNCPCVFHMRCFKQIIRKAGFILLPNGDHQGDLNSIFMPVPNDSTDLIITNMNVMKLTSLGEENVARELEHFSHPHCLSFCEGLENDGKCHGCAEPLSGPAYTCANCRYSLHNSCAEQPKEILKHPLHPQHPLVLFVNPPYPGAHCLCSACGHSLRHFVYHCSSCKFNLDLRCVSLPCTIQHHGHEHPLTMLRKPAKFVCYACGAGGDGNSYLCTTCLVLFHLECASSPLTIKLSNHNHSFRLLFNLDCNHPNEYFCVVCHERVKLDRWYYFCEEFACAAHLRCATSKKRPFTFRNATNDGKRRDDDDLGPASYSDDDDDDDDDYIRYDSWSDDDDDDSPASVEEDEDPLAAMDPMPILDESIYLKTDDVKNCAGEETIAKELNHFSHQHCLIRYTYELKTGEKCNGCTQPLSGPFYGCFKCNFYLHESCTQLRSEIRHPLHLEHRLKLFAELPNSVTLFICRMCRNYCNAFGYRCEYCEFEIDIVCSSILGIGIKHEAHEHALTLSSPPPPRIRRGFCSACYEVSSSSHHMRCSDCNFNLHIGCAKLPRTIWHESHRHHPFTLTYLPIEEDDSLLYYCNICEKERNPKHWFYNCAGCDFPAHISCMVERHPRIKPGVPLNTIRHQHSFTAILERKFEGRSYTAFHCAECNEDIDANHVVR